MTTTEQWRLKGEYFENCNREMDHRILRGRAGREVMRLENTGHPVILTLALARGAASTYTDHGMTWDNTGKNGHYAPFEWQWP